MRESEAREKACAWGVAPKCLVRGCMAWVPARAGYHYGEVPRVVEEDGRERAMTAEDGFCLRFRALYAGSKKAFQDVEEREAQERRNRERT